MTLHTAVQLYTGLEKRSSALIIWSGETVADFFPASLYDVIIENYLEKWHFDFRHKERGVGTKICYRVCSRVKR